MDNKYQDKFLSTGTTILTHVTEKFTEEQWEENEYQENCMVFYNFSVWDYGRSREFVCKFATPEEAKLFVKTHNDKILKNWADKIEKVIK